jgi:hypothetical protein
MSMLIASFIALLLAVAAMAVGVLFGRAPIRGSCGGVGALGCAACTGRCKHSTADNDSDTSREKDAC